MFILINIQPKLNLYISQSSPVYLSLLGILHMKNMGKTYEKYMTNMGVLICYLYVSNVFVIGLTQFRTYGYGQFHMFANIWKMLQTYESPTLLKHMIMVIFICFANIWNCETYESHVLKRKFVLPPLMPSVINQRQTVCIEYGKHQTKATKAY